MDTYVVKFNNPARPDEIIEADDWYVEDNILHFFVRPNNSSSSVVPCRRDTVRLYTLYSVCTWSCLFGRVYNDLHGRLK